MGALLFMAVWILAVMFTKFGNPTVAFLPTRRASFNTWSGFFLVGRFGLG